jgi:hypothetical protein|uniref:Uncharacterized protein n=1 Tax=viral metagenome TaxID=1070528 RepID=A0A6C0ISL2_9ZZZZ
MSLQQNVLFPIDSKIIDLDDKKISINVYSSMLFLINVIIGYKYKYNLYATLFTILWITSVIYHNNSNIYTYYIDQIAIFTVVCYGSYIFSKNSKWDTVMDKSMVVFNISTFLGTIILYHYGKITNTMCADPCKRKGQLYHCLIHLLTSAGHLMIMLL